MSKVSFALRSPSLLAVGVMANYKKPIFSVFNSSKNEVGVLLTPYLHETEKEKYLFISASTGFNSEVLNEIANELNRLNQN